MTDATHDAPARHVEVLAGPANLNALYAKAARPGGGSSGDTLPTTRVERHGVTLDREHIAAFARVCGFRLTDALPATYLHMLAFPLQIHLMTSGGFPFPLLGMVHLRQRLDLQRAVTADESVDVAVWLEDLRPHAKGRQLTVRSEVSVEGAVVWLGSSTYLNRGTPNEDATDETHLSDAVDVAALPRTARWIVQSDIGRRYGKVSGDRNPIHLSSLTAKPFGFPSAIAHGMWTMSRAIAALQGRVPAAATIDVGFKTPLHLPGAVTFASNAQATPSGAGYAFGVRNDRSGKPHLAGITGPLQG
jgi:acyl dehydratase